jgi:hypothetical protein
LVFDPVVKVFATKPDKQGTGKKWAPSWSPGEKSFQIVKNRRLKNNFNAFSGRNEPLPSWF